MVLSKGTKSMKMFAELAGYPAGELPAGTMLDHLGVQLDVMGHILNQVDEMDHARQWVED